MAKAMHKKKQTFRLTNNRSHNNGFVFYAFSSNSVGAEAVVSGLQAATKAGAVFTVIAAFKPETCFFTVPDNL